MDWLRGYAAIMSGKDYNSLKMHFPLYTSCALAAAGTLSLCDPLYAQERTRRPSNWQIPDYCQVEMSIVNAQSNSLVKSSNFKCYGIAVTKGSNLNIHYHSVHPTLGKPFFTFVLVEGPFGNDYPVHTAVMMLGQSDEVALDAEVGQCRLSRGDSNQWQTFMQCSIATETHADKTYLRVIATALFNQGISPDIRTMLD
jgi:hypothetical protein